MAYSINNKVYTDHALMDEVIHNLKIIMAGIILKNENTANENETKTSIEESDYFLLCNDGLVGFGLLDFTLDMLLAYGYNESDAIRYSTDKYQIPESERDDLTKFGLEYFISHYNERNNYYRTLNGLPNYNTTEYDIYITASDISDPRLAASFNFSIPIHQYNRDQLNTLESLGILDRLRKEHPEPEYQYIEHLTNKKIDIYLARKASNWDILYIPSVEPMVLNRFNESFRINRDIYQLRTYQDAYKFESDYYDEACMIMIICQTCADIIAELPEWYIRRDIFDLRSCQYFLESNGIKFFPQIPLKYQIRMVKNINKLIKYKSTTKNIYDILELFGAEGTDVFKYYIFKNYEYDPKEIDPYIDDKGNSYTLKMIRVPLNETYDDYIGDNIYTDDYDEVTRQDKYWDGIDSHEVVKLKNLQKDFSIEGTKYMFIDYSVSESEFSFQLAYFLGLIFNSKLNTDNITVNVPVISGSQYFSLRDLCMLLCCLSSEFLGYEAFINIPFDERKTKPQEFSAYLDLDGSTADAGDDPTPPPPPQPSEWEMDDLYDFGLQGYDIIQYDSSTGKMFDFGLYYEPIEGYPYHIYDFNTVKIIPDEGEVVEEDEPEVEPLATPATYDILLNGNKTYDNLPPYNQPGMNVRDKYRFGYNGAIGYFSFVNKESFADYLKTGHPEFFQSFYGRILGFNITADLSAITKVINIRNSAFGFEQRTITLGGKEITVDGYVLADFGLQDWETGDILFKTTNNITTIEELNNIYESNTACYKRFIEIVKAMDNYDAIVFARYIYRELFTTSFDKDFYRLTSGEIAITYPELLKEKNYTLYMFYMSVMEETNVNARKENIRTILNSIVEQLEFFIGNDDLKYIFSFVPTTSLEAVVNYIQLVINFFKSWKVYFLDPAVTYILDDQLNNEIYSGDRIAQLKYQFWKDDNYSQRDTIQTKVITTLQEKFGDYHKETLDIYNHHFEDPTEDYVFDGGGFDTEDVDIDMNGSDADDLSTYPYSTIDGESVEARTHNKDLDGGFVYEPREYLNIDGGYFNSDDWYDVNGSMSYLNGTRTANIYLNNIAQLKTDIKINDYTTNGIIAKEDGLYFGGNYASGHELRILINEFNSYKEEISPTIQEMQDFVTEAKQIDFNSIIDDSLTNYLNSAIYFNTNQYTNDKANTINQIDLAVQTMENKYNKLFAWQNF